MLRGCKCGGVRAGCKNLPSTEIPESAHTPYSTERRDAECMACVGAGCVACVGVGCVACVGAGCVAGRDAGWMRGWQGCGVHGWQGCMRQDCLQGTENENGTFMAKKNILGKDQLKGFLFTERQVNENIAVVDGIVSPGRVDMGIGMVVTVDVRKEKTGRFNPSNHRHAKNFCICGFSSATSSRRVRVHCCENENFKKKRKIEIIISLENFYFLLVNSSFKKNKLFFIILQNSKTI